MNDIIEQQVSGKLEQLTDLLQDSDTLISDLRKLCQDYVEWLEAQL